MNHVVDWARALGGLFVVLAIITAVGWLLHCLRQCVGMGPVGPGQRRSQVVTVVVQQMPGVREEIVVVDTKDTWLVLGATQQHVQTLHTLPRPAEVASTPDDPSGDGTSDSGKPPRFTDVLSIQLKRHLAGKSE